MLVLDHTAYPIIMDAVISFSPPHMLQHARDEKFKAAHTFVDYFTLVCDQIVPKVPLFSGCPHIIHVRLPPTGRPPLPTSEARSVSPPYGSSTAPAFCVTPASRVHQIVLVLWPHSSEDNAGDTRDTQQIKHLLAAMKNMVSARPDEFVLVGLDITLESPQATNNGLPSRYVSDKLTAYHRKIHGHVDNLRVLSLEEWWKELNDGEEDLVGAWPSGYVDCHHCGLFNGGSDDHQGRWTTSG
ncbi:uncharacterized protein LOC62_04G005320 [Vanrija pseudolonga]|uniref:Uncharacterized protein n=1 Tax=Vanrija pseudolonga TaxID=143232 RepID=A0AAF0YBL6_9TREE|nr:hypothetical protein LOC62_04G005320 [Vanrija pseudolonga]